MYCLYKAKIQSVNALGTVCEPLSVAGAFAWCSAPRAWAVDGEKTIRGTRASVSCSVYGATILSGCVLNRGQTHSEHRYNMVLKTSIAAMAMSTLLLLALSSSADAYGCDPSACYSKCISHGASSGRCVWGVCQCRVHYKRSIEENVAQNED